MYERLAACLVRQLDFEDVSTILEVGCGSGQLTFPFAKKVMRIKPSIRIIALDLSEGPYKGRLDILRSGLREQKIGKSIVAMNGDVRNMCFIEDESVNLVMSNETLGELDRRGLELAVREFYRVLKPGGQMVHGELIQVSENSAQRLMIEANMHSLETSLPRPEWLSPFSDEVAALLHKVGFGEILVRYFETNIRFKSLNSALRKLRQWHVDPVYIEEHLEDVRRHGLEYPMEHLIYCRKWRAPEPHGLLVRNRN